MKSNRNCHFYRPNTLIFIGHFKNWFAITLSDINEFCLCMLEQQCGMHGKS